MAFRLSASPDGADGSISSNERSLAIAALAGVNQLSKPDLSKRREIPVFNASYGPPFLLHILKTGGTTLSDMFTVMFSPDEIVIGSKRSNALSDEVRTLLRDGGGVMDPKWKVGFAHESYGYVTGNLKLKVQPITILREPTLHFRSVYKAGVFGHCGQKESGTFEKWINNPAFKPCQNIQLATLCNNGTHYPNERSKLPSMEEMVEQTKRNLVEMPWFGLTERWAESMCLMYYTFGWKPLLNGEWKPQRVRNDNEQIPPHILAVLKERSWGEYAIYDFATELFDGRVAQMRYEVLNNAAPSGRPAQEVWHTDCLALIFGGKVL